MKIKNLLVILGEHKSIFSEILSKYFKSYEFKKNKIKFILIGNLRYFKNELSKLKYKFYIKKIKNLEEADYKIINFLNIDFKNKLKNKEKLDNNLISKSFDLSLKILKKNKDTALLNGPISKTKFLKKKYKGITEYLASKTKSKNEVMLIYNDKLSVSPITTHVPLKWVNKEISFYKIVSNILSINKFYIHNLKKKPKIAVLGLNPHCETIDKYSEEKFIISPAIQNLKKRKIKVDGPFSTDTFFIKKNIEKYDVVVGMYHDQVLTPLKTLFNFNAINLTIGLPFIRVSPDHGPNFSMYGENKSDPSSVFCAMRLLNRLK